MKSIKITLERALQKCQQNGVRLTSKRRFILSALLHNDQAMSAYELIDYCKTTFDTDIPAMSVYRILDFLQQQQLVHKISTLHKYITCCHIECDHPHNEAQFLICGQCARVQEVSLGKGIRENLKYRLEQSGFRFTGSQVEINGVCDRCYAG